MLNDDIILELKAIKAYLYRNRFNFGYRDCVDTVTWLDDIIKVLRPVPESKFSIEFLED